LPAQRVRRKVAANPEKIAESGGVSGMSEVARPSKTRPLRIGRLTPAVAGNPRATIAW